VLLGRRASNSACNSMRLQQQSVLLRARSGSWADDEVDTEGLLPRVQSRHSACTAEPPGLGREAPFLQGTLCSECEAIPGQRKVDGGVAPPCLCLPINAAAHEVCIHSRHGNTHTLALELAAMVAGVAVPVAAKHQTQGHASTS
jgi:hypothetical protein